MEDVLSTLLNNFEADGSKCSGHINGETALKELLENLDRKGFSFCVRSSQNFEDKNDKKYHFKLQGFPQLDSPFCILKKTHLQCAQGPKFYRTKEKKPAIEDHPGIRRRERALTTKKINCPVTLTVRKVKMFPDYRLSTDSNKANYWRLKNEILERLRHDTAQSETDMMTEIRYYILIDGSHNHSTTTTFLNQGLIPDVKLEIIRLYDQGIKNFNYFQEMFEDYLKTKCDANQFSSASNPSEFAVYDIIYNHITNKCENKIDQEALEDQTIPATPEEVTSDSHSNIPIVEQETATEFSDHQAQNNRKLLQKIRQQCKDLMEATYLCSLNQENDIILSSVICTLSQVQNQLSNCKPRCRESGLPFLPAYTDHDYSLQTHLSEPPKKKKRNIFATNVELV